MNAEYYRNLYEATPAIQMTVDAAGVILLASRWAVDHLTHGEESLINQCLWSWVVPADREDGEQVFAALAPERLPGTARAVRWSEARRRRPKSGGYEWRQA